MNAEARVAVTRTGGVRIARAGGEFDLDGTALLADALAVPGDEGAADTVLDLSDVAFADSAFLHTLLAARAAHRDAGRRLVLAGTPPPVLRLLELTDVTRVFTLRDTVGEALGTLRGPDGDPGPR
ncbi:STAS domain-containing protein [Streptomyces sp. SHP 1-2]|uniref:STAS domain-containing protein n=1 Tax=Streptomyces sp. SHP 1-2 TaxID=2769489 RepID=UPI0022376380|nr:STAS domain-containing protein [Streptomyces sp. SHP 1-2]MCW5253633.1 STAS domain-containing protein [Streptomyces sp. SHP 1-2]